MASFIADKIVMDGLTYDDVLLVPAYSEVLPRTVELSTRFSRNIELKIPFVTAAMDTVTEATMEIAIAREGGIGDDGITKIDAFGKTYLELERIIKDRSTKIEDKNKATEKIIESYDQVKQESESRKHRAQTREQIRKSGPKPGGN